MKCLYKLALTLCLNLGIAKNSNFLLSIIVKDLYKLTLTVNSKWLNSKTEIISAKESSLLTNIQKAEINIKQ